MGAATTDKDYFIACRCLKIIFALDLLSSTRSGRLWDESGAQTIYSDSVSGRSVVQRLRCIFYHVCDALYFWRTFIMDPDPFRKKWKLLLVHSGVAPRARFVISTQRCSTSLYTRPAPPCRGVVRRHHHEASTASQGSPSFPSRTTTLVVVRPCFADHLFKWTN